MNRREHGGIKNCEIDGFDNQYVGCEYGAANFLLSSRMQESCVDFKYSINLDNSYLYCYTAPCEWLHIAYIDALPNLDLSKLSKKIFKNISCDFCHPQTDIVKPEVIRKNLGYCDIIFDDRELYGTHHPGFNEKQLIVLHNKDGSVAWYSIDMYRYDSMAKPYIFSVGAGDRFAAAFIEARLQEFDIKRSQEFAHNKVGKWLEEVNRDL